MPKCWCNRASRGFGYKHKLDLWNFCCRDHQIEFAKQHKENGNLKPMQQSEINAINAGIARAGQYAKEIGKSDLSQFTPEEIYEMFALAYGTTCEILSLDKGDVPF